MNRTLGSSKKNLKFDYDPMGNRIAKHLYEIDNVTLIKSTYYLLDVQGNVISVYEHEFDDNVQSLDYKQVEKHIYGSSRLGLYSEEKSMLSSLTEITFKSELGLRRYELSNHLGNVLTVISDRTIPVDYNSDNTVDYYIADITLTQDFSSFGCVLEDRHYEINSYRYGFNGQERDDEISGSGNHYTAEYWEMDPRLGRRWNLDPKSNPSISSYAILGNNPILYIDPLGDTIKITHNSGFLGLGKKQTLTYENGSLFNADGSAYEGKTNGFLKKTVNALDKTRTGGSAGSELIGNLQSDDETVTIIRGYEGNLFNTESKTVSFDPSGKYGGLDEKGKTRRPTFIGLGHELAHAWDLMEDGKMDFGTWYTTPDGRRVPNAEKYATHWENRLRAENNLRLRKYYTNYVHPPAQIINDRGESLFYTMPSQIRVNPTEGMPPKLYYPNAVEIYNIVVPYRYR